MAEGEVIPELLEGGINCNARNDMCSATALEHGECRDFEMELLIRLLVLHGLGTLAGFVH